MFPAPLALPCCRFSTALNPLLLPQETEGGQVKRKIFPGIVSKISRRLLPRLELSSHADCGLCSRLSRDLDGMTPIPLQG